MGERRLTEHRHDPSTPEDVSSLLDSLEVTDGVVDLPVTVGQDVDPALKPRSVKLTDDVDRRATARAVRLGLSKSAYIRSLIERDLTQAEHKGGPVAHLSGIAAELSRTAAEVDRIASELGHGITATPVHRPAPPSGR